MTFVLVQICAIVACFILREPIKRWPWLFYVLAIAVDLLFIAGSYVALPRMMWSVLFILIQKCTLSLALFVVVMYIGVFSKDSQVSRWLRPIRAELSIIAWILAMGHMAVYLVAYMPRVLTGGTVDGNVLASFMLAVLLLILLLLLGVTSFDAVKRRMKVETWKRVQMLAYPFFILVYIHLLLMLAPSALQGGTAAQVSVAVYSVVFLLYIVLRSVRGWRDSRKHASCEKDG